MRNRSRLAASLLVFIASLGAPLWAGSDPNQIYFDFAKSLEDQPGFAFSWYQLAAQNGHADAQFEVALAYENGDGVDVNLEEARRYYEAAANQNHRLALNNLGAMYAEGQGGTRDLQAAAHFYWRAATLGNPVAANNLGMAYEDGDGVQQNLARAEVCYRIAAVRGDEEAKRNLERIYRNAANRGDSLAQLYLVDFYTSGASVGIEADEAVKWLCQAAVEGEPRAQNNLAVLFEEMKEQYTIIALAWYILSEKLGADNFQELLSRMTAEELMRDFIILIQKKCLSESQVHEALIAANHKKLWKQLKVKLPYRRVANFELQTLSELSDQDNFDDASSIFNYISRIVTSYLPSESGFEESPIRIGRSYFPRRERESIVPSKILHRIIYATMLFTFLRQANAWFVVPSKLQHFGNRFA